jgi:hypothetical protein
VSIYISKQRLFRLAFFINDYLVEMNDVPAKDRNLLMIGTTIFILPAILHEGKVRDRQYAWSTGRYSSPGL